MTRRAPIADTDKRSDAGDSQEDGRHKSAAARSRGVKKTAPAAAKPVRRAAQLDGLTEAELRDRLLAAETRVKELEARLATVSDRIAWTVDRLHSLLDDER